MPDPLAQARRVVAMEAAELQRLHDRLDGVALARATALLRAAVERRGKIIVVGVGKSGHIGEKIAATLTSTGSPAVVLHPLNARHGDLGVVSDGDAILALSASGETDELLDLLPALLRFDVGLIALTGGGDSTLARAAHVWLDTSVEQEACPLNLAPTCSTTVMLALGDALAMVLLEARGFSEDDFARFHPAGQLGRRLLLKVADVMRPREQVPVVTPETPIRRVLAEMTRQRAGAAAVVDIEGRLAGIFTHGDFARHYQAEPPVDAAGTARDLGAEPVGAHMTPRPVTIREDRLAVELLHSLEQSRIDELVVVDADGRPLGLVDTQDLTRLKLV